MATYDTVPITTHYDGPPATGVYDVPEPIVTYEVPAPVVHYEVPPPPPPPPKDPNAAPTLATVTPGDAFRAAPNVGKQGIAMGTAIAALVWQNPRHVKNILQALLNAAQHAVKLTMYEMDLVKRAAAHGAGAAGEVGTVLSTEDAQATLDHTVQAVNKLVNALGNADAHELGSGAKEGVKGAGRAVAVAADTPVHAARIIKETAKLAAEVVQMPFAKPDEGVAMAKDGGRAAKNVATLVTAAPRATGIAMRDTTVALKDVGMAAVATMEAAVKLPQSYRWPYLLSVMPWVLLTLFAGAFWGAICESFTRTIDLIVVFMALWTASAANVLACHFGVREGSRLAGYWRPLHDRAHALTETPARTLLLAEHNADEAGEESTSHDAKVVAKKAGHHVKNRLRKLAFWREPEERAPTPANPEPLSQTLLPPPEDSSTAGDFGEESTAHDMKVVIKASGHRTKDKFRKLAFWRKRQDKLATPTGTSEYDTAFDIATATAVAAPVVATKEEKEKEHTKVLDKKGHEVTEHHHDMEHHTTSHWGAVHTPAGDLLPILALGLKNSPYAMPTTMTFLDPFHDVLNSRPITKSPFVSLWLVRPLFYLLGGLWGAIICILAFVAPIFKALYSSAIAVADAFKRRNVQDGLWHRTHRLGAISIQPTVLLAVAATAAGTAVWKEARLRTQIMLYGRASLPGYHKVPMRPREVVTTTTTTTTAVHPDVLAVPNDVVLPSTVRQEVRTYEQLPDHTTIVEPSAVPHNAWPSMPVS